MNIDYEAQGDAGTTLAEAVDIAKAHVEGTGTAWSNPAIIVESADLPEDLRQEIARHATRLGWPVRPGWRKGNRGL